MKQLSQVILLIGLMCMVVSCFKEDDRVVPHIPGNTQIDTVALTNLYKFQVYYNLGMAAPVRSSDRNLWDLGFESVPGSWHVLLNTSCFMYAADLFDQPFGQLADTTAAIWKFDNSDGNTDSTAIGNWLSIEANDTLFSRHLYIIDRGIDESGNNRGLRQLILDKLVGDTYYFRTANLDGSNQQSHTLTKQAGSNLTLFSFDTQVVTEQQPLSSDWDLLFTQYTTLLYTDLGEPYPYLVTGILINSDWVGVAIDTVHVFEGITLDSISDLEFSHKQDFIGYDWKKYDFDTGSYTIRQGRFYILEDAQGFYYKLRFLGFYDDKGEKGYPSFEFRRL